jgi:hypothetical protein
MPLRPFEYTREPIDASVRDGNVAQAVALQLMNVATPGCYSAGNRSLEYYYHRLHYPDDLRQARLNLEFFPEETEQAIQAQRFRLGILLINLDTLCTPHPSIQIQELFTPDTGITGKNQQLYVSQLWDGRMFDEQALAGETLQRIYELLTKEVESARQYKGVFRHEPAFEEMVRGRGAPPRDAARETVARTA